MTTVYLHIGTMKTGTSALQNFLDENRALLREKGYLYPRLKMKLDRAYYLRNAYFLVWKSEKEGEAGAVAEQRLRNRCFRQLKRAAEKYENIILSDEIIWHHFRSDKDFWPRLIEDLKEINCELKVIVYLRRQDEVVQSLWAQFVKRGKLTNRDFAQWMEDKRYRFFPLNYYRSLKQIEQYVTKENLIVRVYEKDQYEGSAKNIQSDFLKMIGLELTDEYADAMTDANLSLGGNFLEIKRLMNGVPEYIEMTDFLQREILLANNYQASIDRPPKVTMFPEGEQEAFLRKFEKSNRKVAEEYFGREDSQLFLEPMKELPTWSVERATMYRDMVVAFTEVVCSQETKIRELREELEQLRKDVESKHNIIYRACRKMWRLFKRIIKRIRNREDT